MLILDTDHLTIIQRRSEPAYSNLRSRLKTYSEEDVCSTIINFEEQMRGWLSVNWLSGNLDGCKLFIIGLHLKQQWRF